MGQQAMRTGTAGSTRGGAMTVPVDGLALAGQQLDRTADQVVRVPAIIRLPEPGRVGPPSGHAAVDDLQARAESVALLLSGAIAAAGTALHAAAAGYAATEEAIRSACGTPR